MPAPYLISTRTRPWGLSLALASAALVACGGGGDSAEGSIPPSPLVRENYSLVAESPAAPHVGGAASVYAVLNATRLGIGAGALTPVAALDTAATTHFAYLALHYPTVGSNETRGQAGFYAATPSERAVRAGYTPSKLSEFIGTTTGAAATARDCIDSLLENPYALNALAEPWRDVGIAYGTLRAAPPAPAPSASAPAVVPLPAMACVLVVAVRQGIQGQLPDAGFLKTYPYPGQPEVPVDFGPGAPGQQPAPDLQNRAGSPVQVSMADFGALSHAEFGVSRFALKDSMGRAVPARLIISRATSVARDVVFFRDPMYLLPASDVLLLPLSPLAPDTAYTAEFQGSNGLQKYSKAWTFTTRAALLPVVP